MAIPKTGCISMKDFCVHNDIPIVWHNRNKNHTRERIYKCDLLFCVLRDPIARVISGYLFLRNRGINVEDHIDWMRYFSNYPTINDFIKDKLVFVEENQMHFRSQYKWLEDIRGDIYLDKVEFLKFENLENDLEKFQIRHSLSPFKIGHKNKSGNKRITLTEESKSIIRKVYERDYKLIDEIFNSDTYTQ